ncbi:enoyl-CoA hydratase/carnithine racemase [Paraperlucidibaca baekdonensis]|uniref:Enoyl-CoA hydratase/carnithine racemase n=1 Tax=Paraperlucidibaca baekdonensis TaxID=748120 RepID=A0A3E0H7B3_9GAMM|nr:enoyl-CoA hydratase/isomerase family protein [Paraperlucidibaca baekdonensis]REH38964.1 enoyl-CoA hydratase/carnithine racemase [Paraperlucidibaca baekdonensis]
MSWINLNRDGDVWLMTLCHGDNRFNNESLAAWHDALDTIEASEGNAALVITADDAKFFSNGIDIEPILAEHGYDYFVSDFAPRLEQLFLRVARFPMPVAFALNGHTYAGGAIMASAGDIRFMRADRGRFCFPEVNIKIPFTPLMTEVVRLLPSTAGAWEMMSTGAAWGGVEAVAKGVIEHALSETELLPTAMAWAAEMAKKDRATYTLIKRRFRKSLDEFLPTS